MAILAGFMIGIGALVYLSVGGYVGALLFAVGLMTICWFKLHLFTGKVGLAATNEIGWQDLLRIWCGNFVGTMTAAALYLLTPNHEAVLESAAAIVQTRLANGPIVNFFLGVFCGVLMFVAVTGYSESRNFLFTYIPVAVFILCGFNHCIADMMYLHLGAAHWQDYIVLLPTTLGNAVGAIGFNYMLKFCRTM